jgi:hypothetical protein
MLPAPEQDAPPPGGESSAGDAPPAFTVDLFAINAVIVTHLMESQRPIPPAPQLRAFYEWLEDCQRQVKKKVLAAILTDVQEQCRKVMGRPCTRTEAVGHIADALGMDDSTLRRWLQQQETDRAGEPEPTPRPRRPR